MEPEPRTADSSQVTAARRLRLLATSCATALVVMSAALVGSPAAHAEPAGAPTSAGLGDYLDVGLDHSCALQRDRTARCFGRGGAGRLGSGGLGNLLDGPGQAPSSVAVRGAKQVVTGDAHSCVMTEAGLVRCWGQGATGQLGGRARDNRGDGTADLLTGTDDLTTVPLGAAATQLSAGGSFTCALISGGAVRCWGEGLGGRLGTGAEDSRLDGIDEGLGDEASTVPLSGPATAISVGDQHACALLATGDVQCWGVGGSGRLGQLGTDSRLDGIPNAGGADGAVTVPLGGPATAITAGGEHSCALLADGGRVRCWGENGSGQLGSGGTDDKLDQTGTGGDVASTVPLRAMGAANNAPPVPATQISAGENHTCAVMSAPAGELRCWGNGALGQLGTAQITNRLNSSSTTAANAASRVDLGGPVTGLSAGGGTTCAVIAGGVTRCFGEGAYGSHGGGSSDARLDGIVDPATGTDAATIVPLGVLPTAYGDLDAVPAEPVAPASNPTPPPGAGPGPGAAPAPELSFKLRLKGKKATIAALMAPTKAGKCPKKVSAELKLGKKKLGSAKLATKRKGSNCRVAGTVKLSKAVAKKKTVSLTLRGSGVERRTLSVRA